MKLKRDYARLQALRQSLQTLENQHQEALRQLHILQLQGQLSEDEYWRHRERLEQQHRQQLIQTSQHKKKVP